MTPSKIYRLFLILVLNWTTGVFACTCIGDPTTEEAYKRSDLVVIGRIIGMDTVISSKNLNTHKKGIKAGRRQYSMYSERFVRVKILVERIFKQAIDIPDTIFVLTEVECGFLFTPYISKGYADKIFYQYIFYAENWTPQSIQNIKKGRKRDGVHRRIIPNNAFYTSRCGRTQHLNIEELERIEKLRS